ncbi:MAG: zinc-dependent metalloprotease, partial [Gammaproteobacteria bacterium]|nr:zinc-dependent metalloprotease [Gammaproteobacteria bacterium]
KLIGGSYFNYTLRGDGQENVRAVDSATQQQAINALLALLDPAVLGLPSGLAEQISPRPPGYPKGRETFNGNTGNVFDALAPAASAVTLTLDVLLNPQRAARMAGSAGPGFEVITDGLLDAGWFAPGAQGTAAALRRQTGSLVLTRLMQLSSDAGATPEVRAIALEAVNRLSDWLDAQTPAGRMSRAHYALARQQIERWRRDPAIIETLVPATSPPGAPIGALSE